MFSLLLYTWIFFQSFSVNFTLRVLLLEAYFVLKSCGVVGHEILVTAPEAKFPFLFMDLTGTGSKLWDFLLFLAFTIFNSIV